MFILQEMQTKGDQTTLVPAQTILDENEAESAYHTAVAAAAVSSVPVHTVVLMD